MLSIGHMLVGIINGESNLEHVVASLAPDILRASGLARTVTHFTGTKNDDKSCSWIEFPKNWKELKEFNMHTKVTKKFQVIHKPCVIDEQTNIELYEQKNSDVCEELFKAYRRHLLEDCSFDEFVRQVVDCSEKYDDKFVYNSNIINSKELREIITEYEQLSVFMLAEIMYKKTGILYTNKWIAENIKPALDKVYSNDMAESAYSFMKIKDEYNEKIENANFDFNNVDLKKYEELKKFHQKIIK